MFLIVRVVCQASFTISGRAYIVIGFPGSVDDCEASLPVIVIVVSSVDQILKYQEVEAYVSNVVGMTAYRYHFLLQSPVQK